MNKILIIAMASLCSMSRCASEPVPSLKERTEGTIKVGGVGDTRQRHKAIVQAQRQLDQQMIDSTTEQVEKATASLAYAYAKHNQALVERLDSIREIGAKFVQVLETITNPDIPKEHLNKKVSHQIEEIDNKLQSPALHKQTKTLEETSEQSALHSLFTENPSVKKDSMKLAIEQRLKAKRLDRTPEERKAALKAQIAAKAAARRGK